MARVKGRVGSLFVTTAKSNPQATTYTSVSSVEIGQLRTWSFDQTVDTVEVTDMGDKWREFVQTLRGWSGSADLYLDPSATVNQDELLEALMEGSFSGSLATTSGELEGQLLGLFILDDDEAAGSRDVFFGDMIVEGTSVAVDVEGVNTISFRFKGNGLLGYTSTG